MKKYAIVALMTILSTRFSVALADPPTIVSKTCECAIFGESNNVGVLFEAVEANLTVLNSEGHLVTSTMQVFDCGQWGNNEGDYGYDCAGNTLAQATSTCQEFISSSPFCK